MIMSCALSNSCMSVLASSKRDGPCLLWRKFDTNSMWCMFTKQTKDRKSQESSHKGTRCVCETQMPPIMANSKDGLGHKDKYLDASRKILAQEMLMCNMKALIFII